MRTLAPVLTSLLFGCSGPTEATPANAGGAAALAGGQSNLGGAGAGRIGLGAGSSGVAGSSASGVAGVGPGSGGQSAVGGRGPSGGEPGGGTGGRDAGGAGGQLSGGGLGGQEPGGGGRTAGGGRGAASGGGGATAGQSAASGAGGSGATSAITVWLAGDSTMANGETPCPVGWGKPFDALFNDKVTVTNSAVGGRSIRTWLYNVQQTMDQTGECELAVDGSGEPTVQARWTAMLNGMKTGDYLIIQFGINDGDPSCDRHVGLDAFKESLGVMAAAAKERGTQPIFVTPVSSIACTGSTPRGTRGEFVTVTLEAGDDFDVPVIDLHALSVALYTSLGFCPIPGGSDVSASTTGAVGEFFCDDHTHFDTPGAEQIAGVVAKALDDQGLGLAGYLK